MAGWRRAKARGNAACGDAIESVATETRWRRPLRPTQGWAIVRSPGVDPSTLDTTRSIEAAVAASNAAAPTSNAAVASLGGGRLPGTAERRVLRSANHCRDTFALPSLPPLRRCPIVRFHILARSLPQMLVGLHVVTEEVEASEWAQGWLGGERAAVAAHLPIRVGYDPDGALVEALGSVGSPDILVLDGAGAILHRGCLTSLDWWTVVGALA